MKSNKEMKYLLCTIDLFRKYAWFGPLKDKRGITIFNAFQKIISERKPNKIWVDQGSECYNNIFKRFLKTKKTEMYSTYNAERFIRTLKNKIFKHKTTVSKNVYFDVLGDIVNKYNNTVHRAIQMKPIDVTSDCYAENNEDSNVTKLKFEAGDRVRISKYKNIFAKGYTQNCSEEVFIVSKMIDTVPWTYVISELNGE